MTSRFVLAALLSMVAGTTFAQDDGTTEEALDPIAQAIAEREAALGIAPATEPAQPPDEGEETAPEPASSTENAVDVSDTVSAPTMNAETVPANDDAALDPLPITGADEMAEVDAEDLQAGTPAPDAPAFEPALSDTADIDAEDAALASTDLATPVVSTSEPVVPQPSALPHDTHDVLVMAPNAEVHFITTGGMEMRADWTEAARANLTTGLAGHMEGLGQTVIMFDDTAERDARLEQVLLLWEAVNASADIRMPHKGNGRGNPGLSLGKDAILLADTYGSDTAVFVDHLSRVESSGVFIAKVAMGTATGLATGVTPVLESGAIQITRAQVIDLTTGNVTHAETMLGGDAREPEGAQRLVQRVLKKASFDGATQ